MLIKITAVILLIKNKYCCAAHRGASGASDNFPLPHSWKQLNGQHMLLGETTGQDFNA